MMTEKEAKAIVDQGGLDRLSISCLERILIALTDDQWMVINRANGEEEFLNVLRQDDLETTDSWAWQIWDQPYYTATSEREAYVEAILYTQ